MSSSPRHPFDASVSASDNIGSDDAITPLMAGLFGTYTPRRVQQGRAPSGTVSVHRTSAKRTRADTDDGRKKSTGTVVTWDESTSKRRDACDSASSEQQHCGTQVEQCRTADRHAPGPHVFHPEITQMCLDDLRGWAAKASPAQPDWPRLAISLNYLQPLPASQEELGKILVVLQQVQCALERLPADLLGLPQQVQVLLRRHAGPRQHMPGTERISSEQNGANNAASDPHLSSSSLAQAQDGAPDGRPAHRATEASQVKPGKLRRVNKSRVRCEAKKLKRRAHKREDTARGVRRMGPAVTDIRETDVDEGNTSNASAEAVEGREVSDEAETIDQDKGSGQREQNGQTEQTGAEKSCGKNEMSRRIGSAREDDRHTSAGVLQFKKAIESGRSDDHNKTGHHERQHHSDVAEEDQVGADLVAGIATGRDTRRGRRGLRDEEREGREECEGERAGRAESLQEAKRREQVWRREQAERSEEAERLEDENNLREERRLRGERRVAEEERLGQERRDNSRMDEAGASKSDGDQSEIDQVAYGSEGRNDISDRDRDVRGAERDRLETDREDRAETSESGKDKVEESEARKDEADEDGVHASASESSADNELPASAEELYRIEYQQPQRPHYSSLQWTIVPTSTAVPPWDELVSLATFDFAGHTYQRGDLVSICLGRDNEPAIICDVRALPLPDTRKQIDVVWCKAIGGDARGARPSIARAVKDAGDVFEWSTLR